MKRRHKARYPITRKRGFISELLNDHSAVERDDLGLFVKPIKCGFLSVVFIPSETVVIGRLKRGRVFGPLAANPNGIEFNLGVGVFLELLEIREQRTTRRNAELAFTSGMAERFDELEF